MQLRTFRDYYWGTIVQPASNFKHLIRDKKALRFSTFAVLITAILYTLVYVFLIFGGGQPFKPWLIISPEFYYKYNVFFCAPSMFLGWILAAAVVHVLSRFITAAGSFEQTLSVFGFGIGIASWATGIHDILTSFLGAVQVIDQRDYETTLNAPTIWRTLLWIQMTAYLVWFIILFSKGVKAVYPVKNWQAIILGSVGFIIYQLFFLIFNR
jgi:hypothetical protein